MNLAERTSDVGRQCLECFYCLYVMGSAFCECRRALIAPTIMYKRPQSSIFHLLDGLYAVIRRQTLACLGPVFRALHELYNEGNDVVDRANQLARRVALTAHGHARSAHAHL